MLVDAASVLDGVETLVMPGYSCNRQRKNPLAWGSRLGLDAYEVTTVTALFEHCSRLTQIVLDFDFEHLIDYYRTAARAEGGSLGQIVHTVQANTLPYRPFSSRFRL